MRDYGEGGSFAESTGQVVTRRKEEETRGYRNKDDMLEVEGRSRGVIGKGANSNRLIDELFSVEWMREEALGRT